MGIKEWYRKHRENEAPPVYFDPGKLVEPGKFITGTTSISREARKQAKKMLFLYWWCSETGNWDEFPFKETFDAVKYEIENRVLGRMSGLPSDKAMKRFHPAVGRLSFYSKSLDIGALSSRQREKLADAFRQEGFFTFAEEISLYNRIQTNTTRQEKIETMEHIINYEHDRGSFWGFTFMDELREEYERKYGV